MVCLGVVVVVGVVLDVVSSDLPESIEWVVSSSSVMHCLPAAHLTSHTTTAMPVLARAAPRRTAETRLKLNCACAYGLRYGLRESRVWPLSRD